MRRLLGILALCAAVAANGADIRTMRVIVNGNDQLPPVIVLGTDDRAEVSFDDTGTSDHRYLRYSLQHCDADWTPSALVEGEWLDGFNEGHVDNYALSRATLVPYVHYSVTIPNEQTALTRTGNYLIRFYDETDPDATLAEARLYVTDQSATVSGSVDTRTDIDYRQGHQQLTLAVGTEHAQVVDPFADLKVIVTQDGRQDNAVTLTHPSRVRGREAVYDRLPQLIFPAGNEYRRFEALSAYNPGMGVDQLATSMGMYHTLLETDTPRAQREYQYDQTQYGRMRVRRDDSYESDIEAEYQLIHFRLEAPYMVNANVYIDGDLTGRRLDESSRMEYDHDAGYYHKTLLLKQGACNYQYLVLPVGREGSATAPIEGDKYQTSHEYLVRVYARRPDERADRLVAARVIHNS